jgi:dipeptidase E
MKFLLTSAGIRNEAIASALLRLLKKPFTEASVLFIPTAANTEGDDKRWLLENLTDFEKYNFKSIDILDVAAVTKDIWQKRFEEKDLICFGGGNEKYLAEVLDQVGMKDFLANILDNKVYMGISAGSMVTGAFMPEKMYPEIFPEEDFGRTIKDPMGFHNFCFIPHLNSEFFVHLRKEVLENVKNTFTSDVYAMDDETSLLIDSGKIEIVGTGDSWIYNNEK